MRTNGLAGMETIIKRHEANDAHILAMWLLFCFTPSKPTADVDGQFDLGEIGSDAKKNWSRATPYSPTEKRCGAER